jgi:predicted amidophosphoribosyltransferase
MRRMRRRSNMLVLKNVFKDGKSYSEVVDEEWRYCTLCGKKVEIWRELCNQCECSLEENQSAQDYWDNATTR